MDGVKKVETFRQNLIGRALFKTRVGLIASTFIYLYHTRTPWMAGTVMLGVI